MLVDFQDDYCILFIIIMDNPIKDKTDKQNPADPGEDDSDEKYAT